MNWERDLNKKRPITANIIAGIVILVIGGIVGFGVNQIFRPNISERQEQITTGGRHITNYTVKNNNFYTIWINGEIETKNGATIKEMIIEDGLGQIDEQTGEFTAKIASGDAIKLRVVSDQTIGASLNIIKKLPWGNK